MPEKIYDSDGREYTPLPPVPETPLEQPVVPDPIPLSDLVTCMPAFEGQNDSPNESADKESTSAASGTEAVKE